jgi:hypothetical protein
MNERVAKWVRNLPIRWGLGSLILPIVWGVTALATTGNPNPVDGWIAATVRILVFIVLPLGVLGFGWGWSERRYLEHRLAEPEGTFESAIRHGVPRQTWKGMIAGATYWMFGYGLFSYGISFSRMFHDLDSDANIVANASSLSSFVFNGALCGLCLGFISRRNVLRRLAASPPALVPGTRRA